MLENSIASTSSPGSTLEVTPGQPPEASPGSPPNPPPTLTEAYRTCREIARREAKNFYYAFLALPDAKRNAICAVYAFMRHADDLSDDETLPHSARLENLRTWMQSWRDAVSTGRSSDPVFIAVADARLRFNIPLDRLDELVQGTAMDLHAALKPAQKPAQASAADSTTSIAASPAFGTPNSNSAAETYETFHDLYQYCYLVASVVGLVCIRIFEYKDPRAEKLAEELGIAFQLTNILRDVREDAERGRIYLPLEDMAAHSVSPALLFDPSKAGASLEVRGLLQFEAGRAEHYYESGKLLLPMIAADSRPALWVLMTIYHRLLQRVQHAGYDVFSERIRVAAHEKFAILGRGLLGLARYRMLNRRSRS